jgi:hypothetical protein
MEIEEEGREGEGKPRLGEEQNRGGRSGIGLGGMASVGQQL